MMSWGRALLQVFGDNARATMEDERKVEEMQEKHREWMRTIAAEQHKTAMQNYTTKKELYDKIKSSPNFITYARIMGVPAGKEHEYDLSELKAKWDSEVAPNIDEWVGTYKPEAPSMAEYIDAADRGALVSGYKFDDSFGHKVERLFGARLNYREPELRQNLKALAEYEESRLSPEEKRDEQRRKFVASPFVKPRAKEEKLYYLLNPDGTKIISYGTNLRALQEKSMEYPSSYISTSSATKDKKKENDSKIYVVNPNGTLFSVEEDRVSSEVMEDIYRQGGTTHSTLADANAYVQSTQSYMITMTNPNGEKQIKKVVGSLNAEQEVERRRAEGYTNFNVQGGSRDEMNAYSSIIEAENDNQAFLATHSVVLFNPTTFQMIPVVKGTQAYQDAIRNGAIETAGNGILTYMNNVARLDVLKDKINIDEDFKRQSLEIDREALANRIAATNERLQFMERGAALDEAEAKLRVDKYKLAVANYEFARDRWEGNKENVEAQTKYRKAATVLLQMEAQDKTQQTVNAQGYYDTETGAIYIGRENIPPGANALKLEDKDLLRLVNEQRKETAKEETATRKEWVTRQKQLFSDANKYFGSVAISESQRTEANKRIRAIFKEQFGGSNNGLADRYGDYVRRVVDKLIATDPTILSIDEAVHKAVNLIRKNSVFSYKDNWGEDEWRTNPEGEQALWRELQEVGGNTISEQDVRSQIRADLLGE